MQIFTSEFEFVFIALSKPVDNSVDKLWVSIVFSYAALFLKHSLPGVNRLCYRE